MARWPGAPSGRQRCAVRRSASRLRAVRTGWGCGEMARERRGRVAPSRTRGRARAWIARDRGEEREPPEKGAKRPSYGGESWTGYCRHAPASEARSERHASIGDRDRHPKGEDRVSGLRGAGRGEAAPGGIEPGARSPDRAGAQTFGLGERTIMSSRPRRSKILHKLKGSGRPRTVPLWMERWRR